MTNSVDQQSTIEFLIQEWSAAKLYKYAEHLSLLSLPLAWHLAFGLHVNVTMFKLL